MNTSRPLWEGSDIVIAFENKAYSDVIDVAVDVGEDGEILGIEMLGVVFQHPELSIIDCGPGAPSVSIDTEADAIYLRFARGRSVDQLVRQAVITFDDSERVQAVRVLMET